jgi:putative spermidine/putrescine transport system permease protein
MTLLYRALIVLLFVFMLGPLIVIVAVSFNGGTVTIFPPHDLSLRWYGVALGNASFLSAVANSLLLGAGAALFGCLLGMLAALGIDGWTGNGKEVVQTLLLAPLVVPGVVIGIALLGSFVSVGLRDSWVRLLLAHTLICFPYSTRTVFACLTRLEPNLGEAAATLGATAPSTFRHITFPLIRPGLAAGAIFAFVISLDNVPVSVFLVDARTATLPIAIISYLEYNFDPSVAALSAMLIVGALGLALLLEWLFGLRRAMGM